MESSDNVHFSVKSFDKPKLAAEENREVQPPSPPPPPKVAATTSFPESLCIDSSTTKVWFEEHSPRCSTPTKRAASHDKNPKTLRLANVSSLKISPVKRMTFSVPTRIVSQKIVDAPLVSGHDPIEAHTSATELDDKTASLPNPEKLSLKAKVSMFESAITRSAEKPRHIKLLKQITVKAKDPEPMVVAESPAQEAKSGPPDMEKIISESKESKEYISEEDNEDEVRENFVIKLNPDDVQAALAAYNEIDDLSVTITHLNGLHFDGVSFSDVGDANYSLRSGNASSQARRSLGFPELPSIAESVIYHSSPSKEERIARRELDMTLPISPVERYEDSSVTEGLQERTLPVKPMRNKTLSAYRLEQRELGKKVQPRRVVIPDDTKGQERGEALDLRISELNQLVRVLDEHISQVRKAIEHCLKTRKDSVGSSLHVNAERLLRISMSKREACLMEVLKLSTQISKPVREEPVAGFYIINAINVPVANDVIASYTKRQGVNGNPDYHFFCIIRDGATVKATDLLPRPSAFPMGELRFDIRFASCNKESMQIQIEVFGMISPKLDKKEKRKSRKSKKSKGKSSNSSPSTLAAVPSPSFKLLASVAVSKKNAFDAIITLDNLDSNSHLCGWLKLHCDVAEEIPQVATGDKNTTTSPCHSGNAI